MNEYYLKKKMAAMAEKAFMKQSDAIKGNVLLSTFHLILTFTGEFFHFMVTRQPVILNHLVQALHAEDAQ